jgi:hypothetical protein
MRVEGKVPEFVLNAQLEPNSVGKVSQPPTYVILALPTPNRRPTELNTIPACQPTKLVHQTYDLLGHLHTALTVLTPKLPGTAVERIE